MLSSFALYSIEKWTEYLHIEKLNNVTMYIWI